MRKLTALCFVSLFALIGLAESTHTHQFEAGETHHCACPGNACGGTRHDAAARPLLEPPVVVTEAAAFEPLPAARILSEDIFHPPLA